MVLNESEGVLFRGAKVAGIPLKKLGHGNRELAQARSAATDFIQANVPLHEGLRGALQTELQVVRVEHAYRRTRLGTAHEREVDARINDADGSRKPAARVVRLESLGCHARVSREAGERGGARRVRPEHPVLDVVRGVHNSTDVVPNSVEESQPLQHVLRSAQHGRRVHNEDVVYVDEKRQQLCTRHPAQVARLKLTRRVHEGLECDALLQTGVVDLPPIVREI